jgi:hypothetical protein
MDEPRIWPKRWGRLQIESATPAKATVYKLRSCEARLAPEVGTFVGLLCASIPARCVAMTLPALGLSPPWTRGAQ